MRVKLLNLAGSLALGLACAVALGTLAGCGGGQADRLTKQEYLKEIKAIGTDLNGSFEKTIDADFDTSDLRAVADYTDQAAGLFERLADRVDRLQPPEDVQATQDKLVGGLRTFASFFRDVADKVRTAPAAEVQDFASKLSDDPTKLPGAKSIQAAIAEFKAKGYEIGPSESKPAEIIPGVLEPGDTAGKKVFVAGCGGCHTLADAGSTGAIGPNLDQTRLELAAIVSKVTNGGGIMPAFKGGLTEQQILDVASYVSSAAR